ncbi:MAG: 50S ribosomal protein L23 [Anaerolineae bacterium]|nr:50S ribosomal protein L23 [Anaerolineae bacterium]
MHIYEVLRRPIITEKGTLMAENNQYAFEVAMDANKVMVKEAVEKRFGVNVLRVNVMRMPGKTRRFGRRVSTTPSWKKAIVTLAPGQTIEVFEG